MPAFVTMFFRWFVDAFDELKIVARVKEALKLKRCQI